MDNIQLAMLSPQDLLLLLVVALFVFGPKRLPEIGEALGKTVQNFKGAVTGVTEKPAIAESAPPAAVEAPKPKPAEVAKTEEWAPKV